MEAEPEIETNAEPGIKMNAEPEIRTNAELEIGTNAEPEIGTNAEHADINAINEAKQIVNGVMQSNNDPSNDGNRPLNTSTFEDEELLVLFMNCLKDEMRVDMEMQGLIRVRPENLSSDIAGQIYPKNTLMPIETNVQTTIETNVETTIETNVETTIETNVETSIEMNVEPEIGTNAEPEIGMNVEPKIGTNAEPEIGMNVELEIGTNAEPEIGTIAEPEIRTNVETSIETNAEPKIGTNAEPEIRTNVETSIETNAEPKIGTNVETSIETNAEPKIGTNAEPEIRTNAELEIGTNADPEIGTNAESEIRTNAEPEIGMNVELEIGTNAEPEIRTNAEPEIGTNTEPEIGTNVELEIGTNAEPEIRTNAELEIGTNAEPEIGTNAEHADINAINEAEQIAAEVSMDSNSIKILPNGIKIVNGVAQMPFDRSELNDGDQSTFEPRFTNQLQYLKNFVTKDIFRNRSALPFLKPFNSSKDPFYYDIIEKPMDFTTIKKRLDFLWYQSADECIADIRQIFINCFRFNSPSDDVYLKGLKLLNLFNRKYAKMPEDEEDIDCPPKPSLEKYMKKNKPKASKPSNCFANEPSNETTICLNTDPSTSSFDPRRSKRESQMTTRSKSGIKIRKPNKGFPIPLTVAVKKVPLNQPLKECLDFVKELFKKYHAEYTWPFWKPVSEKDFPDYRQKIEKPMDLTTIKNNLETGAYLTVDDFAKDMRLIVSNCRQYNDSNSPIVEKARLLEEMFESRYSQWPEDYFSQKLEIKELKKLEKLTAKRSPQTSDGPVDVQKKLKLLQNRMQILTKKMNNLLKQSGQKKSIDTSSSLISTQITEASDSFQMQSEANEESGEKSIDNPDYLMEDETNPDDNNNGMVQTNFSTNRLI
ncbi:Bromodomain testis-specific protein [Sarcoptes scabiei]|uniref:Bromodomain testis-specific protein n=1 Tax=Sarcoptes scabiei TaxID=52283 RepID=A0A834VGI2_SARSC|nr:Bromodomain testis-specific protein [Sarcoptes scabiei]